MDINLYVVFIFLVGFAGPVLGQWMEIYTTAEASAGGSSEWTLAFRAVSGSMTMVYDLYGQDTPYGNAENTTDHYMGEIIPNWSQHNITKAKVVIVSQNQQKAFFLFNATSADSVSWFSIDRLVDTSYTDLTSQTFTNYFSMEGNGNRQFFINKSYKGCNGDFGWVVVIDAQRKRHCDWERPPDSNNFPEMSALVLYSQKSTAEYWTEYNYTAELPLPPDDACECYCYVYNKTKLTDEELENILDSMKKEMTIDKSTLKKNILKKISVRDSRPSAIAVGVSGALFFSIPFVCLFLIDFLTLKKFLDRQKMKRHV